MKEYYKFMGSNSSNSSNYHSSNNIPPNYPAEIITSLMIISKGGVFGSDLLVRMGSHGLITALHTVLMRRGAHQMKIKEKVAYANHELVAESTSALILDLLPSKDFET